MALGERVTGISELSRVDRLSLGAIRAGRAETVFQKEPQHLCRVVPSDVLESS